MSSIDMTIPNSMFDGILPSDDLAKPISVNIVVPYLDVPFIGVDEMFHRDLLEAALSIFLSRFSNKPPNTSGQKGVFSGMVMTTVDEFISQTDDYELMVLQSKVGTIVDIEVEDQQPLAVDEFRMKQEEYYENIVHSIIESFREWADDIVRTSSEMQMDVMLTCFEVVGEIVVNSYRYDKDNHRLWLSILG